MAARPDRDHSGDPHSGSASRPGRGAMLRWLYEPIDIGFLVLFRIAFGLLMLKEVFFYFKNDWIAGYFLEPPFHFKYYAFGWVKAWPGPWMYVHFAGLALLALFISLGLFYRWSAALFCVGFTYVFLLEKARYLNHFYLIVLVSFLMIFLPAHRAVSLDALMRPRIRSSTTPRWTLVLLQIQIGIPYFYGGLAKFNADWLRGQPMGLWLAKLRLPDFIPSLDEPWAAYIFSYGGLLLDLLVVPLLLWRRTRLFAVGAVLFFHVMNSWMFHIDIFPWFMIAATVLIFCPDWFRFGERWKSAANLEGRIYEAPHDRLSARQQLTCWLAGAFVVVQLVLPFRHCLYPGNATWTEEGSRFAWRMMLRDKEAFRPTLLVTAVKTDGSVLRDEIPLSRMFPDWQRSQVIATPEMIAEFAHMCARRLEEQGYRQVDIRANVSMSLNGRKPQPLIDPNVNLAQVQLDLRPKEWIVPLSEPLPRRQDLVPDIR